MVGGVKRNAPAPSRGGRRHARTGGGSAPPGFTLLELMIALALGLVILGAAHAMFNLQNPQLGNQEQVVDIQQNARAAIDIIGREIRMAGFNPQRTAGTFGFQYSASEGRATNAGSVAFTTDNDGDGTLDANDPGRRSPFASTAARSSDTASCRTGPGPGSRSWRPSRV